MNTEPANALAETLIGQEIQDLKDELSNYTSGWTPKNGEAEELRTGIEKILEDGWISGSNEYGMCDRLQSLLDEVDARDSLRHLEEKQNQAPSEAIEHGNTELAALTNVQTTHPADAGWTHPDQTLPLEGSDVLVLVENGYICLAHYIRPFSDMRDETVVWYSAQQQYAPLDRPIVAWMLLPFSCNTVPSWFSKKA